MSRPTGSPDTIIELPLLARLPNCFDVLLGQAELHRLEAARHLDRLGDPADAFRGRGRHGQHRLRLTLGLVDLLLPLRFRVLDDLLLVAFGGVDRGVALTFGLQDRRRASRARRASASPSPRGRPAAG